MAAGTSSENVACFSLVSPTDAKMFADCGSDMREGCKREERMIEEKGRNKERRQAKNLGEMREEKIDWIH